VCLGKEEEALIDETKLPSPWSLTGSVLGGSKQNTEKISRNR